MGHYFINDDLLSHDIKKNFVDIKNTKYYFYTDNGVFSKNELDYGTGLLINSFLESNKKIGKVLDVGCGCGPIGICLALNNYFVDMIDINKRAILLTKKGLEEQNINANVFISDAYENVTEKYDYIISNPPIRVGKEKLYQIVMNAKNFLNEDGEVWLVVRKDKGANSLIKDMNKIYKKIEIINRRKGFFIIKAY